MSKFEVTDQEITLVGPILQRLMWADKETKAKIQKFGVNVLPINFYSSTPSLEEIESSYEYTAAEPPYCNTQIFEQEKFRQTLEEILKFSTEFNPPIDGDEEHCRRFFWKNSQFSYSDAMSYYCFVRLVQPSTIIEIGSGFSTLVALEAIEKNRTGTIHCIEPFPREFLKRDDRITLHTIKAQDISPGFLNDILQDNDILFIDSTHTVKTGSDCLHIYLRLLPEIKRNIFVQVHDVFLPFGMPKEWLLHRQIFWTEQYLLLAFLVDNPKASVLYGSNYNAKWNTSLMESLMGGKYSFGGGSLWFRYNGNLHDSADLGVRLPDASKNELVLETVSNLGDFLNSSFTRDWLSRRHQESEAAILRLATSKLLTAYCTLCEKESRFSLPLDFPSTDVKTVNWRESLVCEYCGLNNRIRFAFGVMRDICKALTHSKIYITEQATVAYAWLKHHYPNTCGSEFVLSSDEQRMALESYIRELTHSITEILRVEDLTHLSFSDSSFEFILSFDVLEHIPDYLKAVQQCYRCLRPNGYMLLSVPFRMKDESTLVRAKVAADGAVEHLMEPEYHGDPTQSAGCLCYYHFGWDLIDAMKVTGFRDVTILLGWSLENAHWGDVNLLIARK